MTTPQVISTSPADQAVDITIDSIVSFRFNTPLDKATINSTTFVVFDPDTLEPVAGAVGYAPVTNTIRFLPSSAFLQNKAYAAVAVGSGSGGPVWIKSLDGDSLAEDYRIDFRTKREQYVSLDEVAERTDIELVGPIRAVEAVLPPALLGVVDDSPDVEILDSYPKGFTSEVSPCIDEVTLTTSFPLQVIVPEDAFVIETYPALGIEEYLGAADGQGLIWLNDSCAPTGVYEYAGPTGTHQSTPPVFANPTGHFTIDGSVVTWQPYSGEPCFMYNQEVHFIIRAGTTGVGVTGANFGLTGEFSEDSEIVFTTRYSPKYIDARMLRVELGTMVKELFDDTLNRIIHKNSIDAWEQAAGNFDFDNPYPAVRRYVKFASIIDVIDSISLANSGGLIMDEDKMLGDFRYRKGGSTRIAMHPKYDQAKKELAKAKRELRAYRGQYQAVSAVRGINHAGSRQDDFMRTWDNWRYWTYEGLVGENIAPGSNMAGERELKLNLSNDHHGNSRAVYGATPAGLARSIFKCRDKDST